MQDARLNLCTCLAVIQMKKLIYLSLVSCIIAGCDSQRQKKPEVSAEIVYDEQIARELTSVKWRKTKLKRTTILALQETPSGHLLAGTPDGLWYSADDGISWKEVPDKVLASAQINCLASDGKYLYAGVGMNGIYRSSDNGINWVQLSQGLQPALLGVKDILPYQGKIYAGTTNGIFLSLDSALTWLSANKGVPVAPLRGEPQANYMHIQSLIAGGSKIYALTEKGVLISFDQGGSWTLSAAKELEPYVVSSLLCVDENIYVGRHFQEGIYKSSDGGLTWKKSGLEGNNLQKMLVSRNGLIYAGTNGKGVFRTTDNGLTWTELNKGLPSGAVVSSITSTSSGTILVGIENHGIYRLQN